MQEAEHEVRLTKNHHHNANHIATVLVLHHRSGRGETVDDQEGNKSTGSRRGDSYWWVLH